jgi:shikimate kinase
MVQQNRLVADRLTLAALQNSRSRADLFKPPNRYTNAVEVSIQTAAPSRLVLTGFMGSGKSTLGPLLAARLGWTFLDVDEVIEAEAGVTIAELFARHGEPAFRAREAETIARLIATDALVLALGGGAIEHEATLALLLTAPGTLLVHLEVTLATTLQRCRGTEQSRPILADQANLEARYLRRLPLYRRSHLSIPVDALIPKQAVEQILSASGIICGKSEQ